MSNLCHSRRFIKKENVVVERCGFFSYYLELLWRVEIGIVSGFCRALLCAVKQWNSSNNASALHSKALRSVLQVSCAASSELQERRNIEKCPKSSRLRLAVGSLNSLLLSYANEQRLRCFGIGEESRQQPTKFAELQMIVVHFVDFQMCFFFPTRTTSPCWWIMSHLCSVHDFQRFLENRKTEFVLDFYCTAQNWIITTILLHRQWLPLNLFTILYVYSLPARPRRDDKRASDDRHLISKKKLWAELNR